MIAGPIQGTTVAADMADTAAVVMVEGATEAVDMVADMAVDTAEATVVGMVEATVVVMVETTVVAMAVVMVADMAVVMVAVMVAGPKAEVIVAAVDHMVVKEWEAVRMGVVHMVHMDHTVVADRMAAVHIQVAKEDTVAAVIMILTFLYSDNYGKRT